MLIAKIFGEIVQTMQHSKKQRAKLRTTLCVFKTRVELFVIAKWQGGVCQTEQIH